jgi:hypothetical protein
MPNPKWECKTCAKVLDTEELAIACEQSHHEIKAILSERWLPGARFPHEIQVEFSDGYRGVFKH